MVIQSSTDSSEIMHMRVRAITMSEHRQRLFAILSFSSWISAVTYAFKFMLNVVTNTK